MRARALTTLAAVFPLIVQAATGSGFVRTDGGSLELTGQRSFFGVCPALEPGGLGARPAAPLGAADRAPAAAAPDPCLAARTAYVRHLLRTAGIEDEDPLALVEALAGHPESSPLAAALLAGVDPLRPLAWDSQLRSLARDLERCHRAGQ